MQSSRWFGVDISFQCPFCKNHIENKVTLSVPFSEDYGWIKKAITQRKLLCSSCRKEPADGIAINVRLRSGTHDELKAMGY